MSEAFTVQDVPALSAALQEAVSAVILGADHAVHDLILAALCGGHVLLEDLPGTGKTTLVKAFAKAAGCDFCRIQCTPDLLPADITGYEMLVQQPDGSHTMQFRKGPVFTNLLLADEINRMAPRSQSGLLECMAERQVTAGGSSYALPEPFLVFATQNPIEMQGTFPLPEAQLDRFFMRLEMGQPAREQELSVLNDRQTGDPLDSLTAVTSPEILTAVQEAVRTVTASPAVLDYLLDLADATRHHPQLRYGLSTRGVLALRHAAQANAAVSGRTYLLPDDIKAVFPAVCAHRLHLAGGLTADRRAVYDL
ncbi:MAG: MoxR family ATPase, partial [Oscillospiraceae bacterium]|nr:MoxR family ATPase [Oscillospiraceae bacterium]